MEGRDPTRLVLDADMALVSTARRFVRETLAEVPAVVVDDVQLIASELVTNAIEHGPGGPVILELDRLDGAVELTVQSPTPTNEIPGLRDWKIPTYDSMSGRGLGIVRTVADSVKVRRTESFFTVVAQLHV